MIPTRDILFLSGALCMAVGPVLMHHVNNVNIYLAGEVLLAIGPVLMGSRAVLKDPEKPQPPQAPPNDH